MTEHCEQEPNKLAAKLIDPTAKPEEASGAPANQDTERSPEEPTPGQQPAKK